jgi:acetyl-CoA acetyltransferase
VTPAYFALRAQRLLRESGLTRDDLARVVVKNRHHGVANPDAMFRKEVTAEEVLASRVVCEPLHLFMLCSPNEGAAAVVLRRAEGGGGVTLASAVLRSHLPGSVLGEATPLAGVDDTAITPPTTLAARDAYAEAGVGPEDVDVVECQDTDAARELLAWEELGLCGRGEQRGVLDTGDAEIGGRRPVNPSGGLLSKGEPLGASGLGQVVELVHQLRGEAGPRQVDGARVGLAHTVGRGANASVTVLTR